MHVKLTGQRMTEEEATKALCQFNTCFVSLLSLERCGLISVPPILIEKFANLSSLNLRDNMLTSLEGLSALTTLRILNCSKNQISTLPIDFVKKKKEKRIFALLITEKRIDSVACNILIWGRILCLRLLIVFVAE